MTYSSILDLYFTMSMGRLSPIRPVTRLLIGLLLISVGGSVFYLNSNESDPSFPVLPTDGSTSIWKQMSNTHKHPLLTWAQALTNRPVRDESLSMVVDVELLTSLVQQGIDLEIPPLDGTVHLLQQVSINGNGGSGSISLSGSFIVNGLSVVNAGTQEQETESMTGTTIGISNGPTEITLTAQLNFLRSGETTWRYLDDLLILQSGDRQDFLLIAWAYLKEYEDTWIEHTNSPSWIRNLQTFSIYEKLANQIDQHLINTASGTTQLLIDGPKRGIDATLDTEGKLSAQFRFPEYGLRTQIDEQEKDDYYDISLTHYRLGAPVATGTISFTPTRKELTSVGTWAGSRKDQLFYSGSHQFTVAPRSLFSVTPPSQYRNRADIVASRKTKAVPR